VCLCVLRDSFQRGGRDGADRHAGSECGMSAGSAGHQQGTLGTRTRLPRKHSGFVCRATDTHTPV